MFNDNNIHHFMLIRLDRCGDKWRSEYNQNEWTALLQDKYLQRWGQTHTTYYEQKSLQVKYKQKGKPNFDCLFEVAFLVLKVCVDTALHLLLFNADLFLVPHFRIQGSVHY